MILVKELEYTLGRLVAYIENYESDTFSAFAADLSPTQVQCIVARLIENHIDPDGITLAELASDFEEETT